jgi:hypothetical protein
MWSQTLENCDTSPAISGELVDLVCGNAHLLQRRGELLMVGAAQWDNITVSPRLGPFCQNDMVAASGQGPGELCSDLPNNDYQVPVIAKRSS